MRLTLLHKFCLTLIVAAFLLGMIGAVLFSNYENLGLKSYFEYASGKQYLIRFFDRIELYINMEHRLDGDTLTFIALMMAATTALGTSLLMMRAAEVVRPEIKKYIWFWLVIWLGLTYLGLDEWVGIHETLGNNMQFLLKLPFLTRPDDIIGVLYLIIFAVVMYYFWRFFLENKAAIMLFMLAGLSYFLAVVSDIIDWSIEEYLELGSAWLILVGMLVLGATHLMHFYKIDTEST